MLESAKPRPLPKKAVELSLQNLKTVTYDGQPVIK